MKKYYLVIADVSREPYSTAEYLFGIFESKEDAITFMREWKPQRKNNRNAWGDWKSFDFTKGYGKTILTDDELVDRFVKEFDCSTPLCVGSYIE